MIEKPQDNLHLILHDSPEPPRLLVLPKRSLTQFTVVVPALVAFAFILLLGLAWFKGPGIAPQLKGLSLPKLPSIKPADSKVHELETELAAMKKANEAIQAKLTTPPTGEAEVWLGPVKRPYGLQDLTNKHLLRLESVALENVADHQTLRFNLVNASPDEQKIAGHIFVIQLHAQGMGVYPAPKMEELADGLRYNVGESFAVSRLRPVEAPFPMAKDSRFLVLLFSREGDLLTREILTGPFKTQGSL